LLGNETLEGDDVVKTIFPQGHFYSPQVDNDEVRKMQDRIWPANPGVLGIDLRDDNHRRLLEEEFPKYAPDFNYPVEPESRANAYDYYLNNSQYAGLDAMTLFCMLQMLKPKRLMELGSGYSTLLAADVKRRFLSDSLSISCVEPYPLDFLKQGVPGVDDLFRQKIEDLPVELFSTLDAGDFLFIDTSHVSKAGSDVNHIYFEILPRLSPGVIIHIHDIFLPEDYPKSWVIDEGRSWNEQYIVRALLMYSNVFEVMFGCYNAYFKFPDLVRKLFNGTLYGGGSLWIRKIA